MTGPTVNIADFRCRAMKARGAHPIFQLPAKPSGPVLVASRAQAPLRRWDVRDAAISESPAVFDIGIAREAQRMHRRLFIRPVPIQRRAAKVIRFGEAQVETALNGGDPPQRVWRRAFDSPLDLPPAA